MTTATARDDARSSAWVSFALLFSLWLIWGVSWPAMRIVFTELPVWQFRATTSLIGGTTLLLMGIGQGGGWRIPRKLWPALGTAALFNIAIWNICVGYGLANIGAGHGAIVVYTMPVWTALLSALVLHERLTARKLLALAMGIAGVLLLLFANLGDLGGRPVGIAFMLGASFAWAFGTIAVKRVAWPANMSALAGWQLLIGAVPLAIVAAFAEKFTLDQMSERAALASVYVVLGALVGGYWLWFRIVDRMPASIAAIGTLMVPVIGVVSGALILAEPFGWREGAALVLVLSAIGLVVFAPRGRG
jgi:drug/metabolite transporter (DMT)-like permease